MSGLPCECENPAEDKCPLHWAEDTFADLARSAKEKNRKLIALVRDELEELEKSLERCAPETELPYTTGARDAVARLLRKMEAE